MLYKGDQKNFEDSTVHDDIEEQVLRDNGWVDYIDLPEPELKIEEVAPSEAPQSFVTTEQFDALGEENTKLKEELVEALKENQKLRKQIRFKQVEDMPADELRKLLDERKVEYGARDGKPALINLVLESENQS